MKILMERYPYRFCEAEGKDRGWIEKYDTDTKRYRKMYECDSSLQLLTAMEDINYTRWLDPEGVMCNTRNVIKAPYSNDN